MTGIGGAVAADRVSYTGSVPKWATPANDAGAAPATETFEGEIFLPLRDQAGAEKLAKAVSSPLNSGYRKALSPTAWIARFSPTKADFNANIAYLKSQGLTIFATPANREFIVFRGTAAQLGAAFSTTLHTYTVDKHRLVGPSRAPSVPTALAGKVSGISLDQSRMLTRPDLASPEGGTGSSEPSVTRKAAAAPVVDTQCSNYAGEHTATVPAAYNGQTVYPTYICGYTPSQLRSAYGLDKLNKAGVNGSGQTIAIIDAYASPTILDDANTYAKSVGDPTFKPGQYKQIVPAPSQFVDQDACQDPSGWQTEQTLDVESSHGIAPGANILYVGGFNCGGGLDIAMSTILDNKLSNIVSNSYGNVGEAVPTNTLLGQNNLYIQAAGEGIGLYFSSGDNGDEVAALGYPSPDFAASSPWVTAVGGTSIGIDKNGKIAYETGWGSTRDQIILDASGTPVYANALPGSAPSGGFRFGAGGGTSAVFAEPDYQRGVVPTSLSRGFRVSPDVSAIADPYTGFLIGYSPIVDDTTLETGPFGNATFGGTSLATPVVAAQIAIVQQATHSTIGFANPTLYGLDRILPSAFRDVVPQTPPRALAFTSPATGLSFLITHDRDTSLKTAKGYDNVTGMGGVTFNLLTLLASGRH
jgi:subtilase family serine protease